MKHKTINFLLTTLTLLALTFSTLGVNLVSAATVTVFSDNFESGYANWSMSGLWNPESQAETCGSLRAPFPSPTNAAYYGLNGSCTFDNGAANAGALTLLTPVALPTTGTAQLTFYSYEQTECDGTCGFDERIVEISTNGGTSWTLMGNFGTENVWYQRTFDLSAYKGQNILIRFSFDTVDDVGNNFFGWMVDSILITATTGPTLNSFTRQNPTTSPTNADTLVFRATFNEDVQNVDAADFAVNGTTTATVTNVTSVNASTYDITVSGGDLASLNGTVGLNLAGGQNIQNLAGIAMPAGEPATDDTYTLDNTAPSVTINQAVGQVDPTNASPINFTVVISKPINTTTFTAADVSLGGTASGTLTAIVTEITPNDGTAFNIAVSGMTGNGTVTASIGASSVQDPAGNNNTASTSADNTVTYDNTNLAVTVNQSTGQLDPTNALPINFTATFSKPINITTFTAADVSLGGTAPGTLTAVVTEITPNDGTTFNIAVSGMTGNGTVTASIAANTVQDSAANNNTANTSTDNTVVYDMTNPSVSSNDLAVNYKGTGPASFIVTFNKDVADPAGNAGTDDVTNPANFLLVNKGVNNVVNTLTCSGGVVADDTQVTVTSVSYDNVTFKATVTLANSLPVGSYRLFICGTTSIVDAAGNPLNGGTDYTFDFVVQAAPSTILPATGFPQNMVTTLPLQPASKAYASYSDLWLEIPKLNVKMSIVGVPITEKNWDVTWLGNDAGWLNGSAFPTWSGNSVLTGHVWDAYNKPGPFAKLKELQYGDKILVHAFGQVYTYEVRESKVVSPTSIATVFKHEKNSWVTLVTCEEYKELLQKYSYRRALRAVLVSVK